jgi:4-aminobutyrate aminotransferase
VRLDLRGISKPVVVVRPPGPKTVKMSKMWKKLSEGDFTTPVIMDEQEGIWVKDIDGNIYVDFISGRCVANVGYRHPSIVKACKRQLDRSIHGASELAVRLTQRLVKITPGEFQKRVYYGLSGSDTSDCAIKAARWSKRRPYIVAFTGAYHGMTYGSLSVSSYTTSMRKGFYPVVPGVFFMPYPYCYRCPFGLEYPRCSLKCLGYIEDVAFKTYVAPEEVAAVIVEPIEGDAGWLVPPDNFLPGLRKLCDKYGIAFIAEEVQTGFGRTGKMWCCDHWSVVPDMITLGKSIAAGLPMSAVVMRSKLSESENGEVMSHGYTCMYNPVACAAALANIDVIEKERLVENSARVGEAMMKRLTEMREERRLIGDVRGKGLLIGVEIVKDKSSKEPGIVEADKIVEAALRRGIAMVSMGAFGTRSLRIAPPLVITEQQAMMALDLLDEAITEVERA